MARGEWQTPEISFQPGAANYMPPASVGDLTPATFRLERATEEAEVLEAERRATAYSSNIEQLVERARYGLEGEQ